MKVALVTWFLMTCVTRCYANNEDMAMSADRHQLEKSLEAMEKELPPMDYNDKSAFESYIQNLTEIAMINDTHIKLDGVEFGNRTADDDLYNAMHNIRIKPDIDCYPPGFKFFNYSGYHDPEPKVHNKTGEEQETVHLDDVLKEIEQEDELEKKRDRELWEQKQAEKRAMEKTMEDTEERAQKREAEKELTKLEKELLIMENIDKELNKNAEVDEKKEEGKDIETEKIQKDNNTAEERLKKEEAAKVKENQDIKEVKEKQVDKLETKNNIEGNKEENGKTTHEVEKDKERREKIIKEEKSVEDKVNNEKKEGDTKKSDEHIKKTQEKSKEKKAHEYVEEKVKRKRRNVADPKVKKDQETNQIIRDMIIDDQYHQQMNELNNKINDKAHIKNYLYFNFEHKDWYKRYKRDLNEAFENMKLNINDEKMFERNYISETINHAHSRSKRDLGDYEKEKDDFTKQLANFEINQANIKGLIDKGIGLNMQKAMKLSIDYALKSYVNTSSSLDESVQRFFVMKQEYMNLIDKWYHGVVIDLPNYLKSQERKKINLSFDDDQPTPEEREKLNKLNEYERIIDAEFAEVGIHYGKTLLNNYCDMDDLFYKYHRENNQVDIKTVFSEANTKELLKKEKITA